MKFAFTILTLLVTVVTITPRQSLGQYAWVPVYSDSATTEATAEAAADATTEAANSVRRQTSYATRFDSDLEDFDNVKDASDFDKVKGASDLDCKTGCDCRACRGSDWMSRSFFGLEYLHWWNKGRFLPPLVTGGPDGILDATPAPILFGNQDVGGGLQAGGRLTAGLWLDDCKESAVVLRAFANEGDNTPYSAATPGTPFLAVPFNDTFGLPGPNSFIIGRPGVPGDINASASNDVFGGDIYYRTRLDSGCDFRIDLLGGFQYSRIDDDLILATNSPDVNAPFNSRDLFEATNKFTAGELGLLGELNQGPVTIQMMGKLGLGNMQQKVAISGTGNVGNGGIFAQDDAGGFPFNAGIYNRDVLAWSPEASVKLIWELRDNVSITVGYTFLYWTNVALAGDHVDTSINSPVIFGGAPNANNPTFAFQDTDFWVQTIDIGFAVRY